MDVLSRNEELLRVERFARLFESGTAQVLFYVEYDHAEDETILHQICKVDGFMGDVRMIFDAEDQAEKAAAALDAVDQSRADRVARLMRDMT